jgi:ribosome-binding factor A
MKSQRQLQVGENIKRVMSEIFIRDDVSSSLRTQITILQADVSPDVRSVKFFVSFFGNDVMHEKIVVKLNERASYFRYQLAKKIFLRFTPEVSFVLDKTEKYASGIEALISKESEVFIAENLLPKIEEKIEEVSQKTVKKASTKKVATKKVVAKKSPVKKIPAKKAVTKKASTKKTVTKEASVKKTTTKEAPVKKIATKKVTAKKVVKRKS